MAMTTKHILTSLAVAVFIGLIVAGALNRKTAPTLPSQMLSATKYALVEQWDIGTGVGRAIAIDQAHRTDAGLRALADQLTRETKDVHGQVLVLIYDDPRAAALRANAFSDELNERFQQLHDAHLVGTYSRDPNTGHHSLTIALNGVAKGIKTKLIRLPQ